MGSRNRRRRPRPCCPPTLAVPVLGRGTLQAVLVLENRLIRGAFTAERLDAVKLIAGQLAVSLDNAQLYAQFCTTAPSSGSSRLPCGCARRWRRCRPISATSRPNWTASARGSTAR